MLAQLPVIIASIIAGILLQGNNIIAINGPEIVLICFLATITYLITQNNYAQLGTTALLSCILGMFSWQYQCQKQLRYEEFFSNYTLNVIGTITDQQEQELKQKKRLEIHITAFHTTLNLEWQSINAKIIIHTTNTQELEVGDTVIITKLTCAPLNESLRNWLRKNNYAALCFYTPNIKTIQHPLVSLKKIHWNIRQYLVQQFKLKLSPQAYGLFTSIFLGNPDKNNIYAYHKFFSWWGLNHYLARAGLHTLILFLILRFLIGIFTSRFMTKTILHIGVSTFYYLITWQNIPFIRAFLVLIGGQCCHLLHVPINTLHLLNLILLMYILINPQSIFFLDFQLTFAITYTLVFIGRYTKKPRSL